jgi:hypothetical protein
MKTLKMGILAALFSLAACAYAQDEILSVDERVNAMKAELNLTQAQADQVKPIMQKYADKRQDITDSLKGMVSVDNNAVLHKMEKLREEEGQELGKVLTDDQMRKWNNKQRIGNLLNRDQARDTGWDPKSGGFAPGVNF